VELSREEEGLQIGSQFRMEFRRFCFSEVQTIVECYAEDCSLVNEVREFLACKSTFCSYVLELSAGRTAPYQEVGGLRHRAGYQVHISGAAGTGHRGLQDPSLEQEIYCVLVGISESVNFVM
jgi:hypothetical protein